jgi:hypothetical protein
MGLEIALVFFGAMAINGLRFLPGWQVAVVSHCWWHCCSGALYPFATCGVESWATGFRSRFGFVFVGHRDGDFGPCHGEFLDFWRD